MKQKVYLETTIVSYYKAKPSADIITLARQRITEQWWQYALDQFDIHVSPIVIEEAGQGDSVASQKRLEAIRRFKVLSVDDAVQRVWSVYSNRLGLPVKALRDAGHLAVASVHGIDYLVTWNCAHIANGDTIKRLMRLNEELGLPMPVIVTPEELMGRDENV
jgi:predicted nucleic acid-binding protein